MDSRGYARWLESVLILLKRTHLSVADGGTEWIARGVYHSTPVSWRCPKVVTSGDEFVEVRRSLGKALAGKQAGSPDDLDDIDGETGETKTFRAEVRDIFVDSQRLWGYVEPVAVHEFEAPDEAQVHIPPSKPRHLDGLMYSGIQRRDPPIPSAKDEDEPPPSPVRHVAPRPEAASDDGRRRARSGGQPRTPEEVVANVVELSREGQDFVVIFAVQVAGLGLYELRDDQKARLLIEMARAYYRTGDPAHASRALAKAKRYVRNHQEVVRDLGELDRAIKANDVAL